MTKKFTSEELIALHECLKYVNVTNKMPPSEYTDNFINAFLELLDQFNSYEQLSICLYMSHWALLNILEEEEQ